MSDKPETLADIVRELREDSQHVEDEIHDDDFWSNDEAAGIYRDLADRIEAAAERERRKYERLHECFWSDGAIQNIVRQLLDERNDLRNQNPKASEVAAHFAQLLEKAATRSTGNAAAMREALEQALAYCESDQRSGIAYSDNDVLVPILRSALAAPPTPPSDAAKMRDAILAIKSVNDRRPHDAAGYEINDIIEAALAAPARNCDRTKDEAESAFKAKFGRPWNTAEDELASWLFAPAEGGAE